MWAYTSLHYWKEGKVMGIYIYIERERETQSYDSMKKTTVR